MKTYMYFDIETIPCQDPAYLDTLRAKVKPPANIKKPESIAKWLDENRDRVALDMLAKTSFDGGRGHVCTISWAKDDGEIHVAHAETLDQERGVIEMFFASLDPYHSETLVGHHISGFDIGFLRKRAIVLGIKMPDNASFPRDPKPWDRSIDDTMTMWAGSKDRISMNDLADILGIEGKGDFTGSMVAAAWANGEHQTISDYCKDDVRMTREIHKRFMKAGY